MGLKTYLFMGALAGLIAGLLIDLLLDIPTTYMRLTQASIILFSAMISAFMYKGARAVTAGREPSISTDRPRSRRSSRFALRRPRS
ncbi:MAG: hypothetical protein KBI44_18805 [Thermoanaerobaculia bacterium]|jgi:hypothetical protein|nr:hypothetical protein [Thermoanaerobaculia bacterium]